MIANNSSMQLLQSIYYCKEACLGLLYIPLFTMLIMHILTINGLDKLHGAVTTIYSLHAMK